MSLTEKQLAMRRSGITATDVRALSGLDPYGRTPHDVWSAKVLGVENVEETEAMSIGTELEPIVIPRVAKKIGRHALRMDPNDMTVRSRDYPREIATPDAFFAPTAFHPADAIGQVKVCGLRTAGSWGPARDGVDGIPEHVLIQCAWELSVTGLDLEYVGALIGTEVRVYELHRTPAVEDLIGALRQVANKFWVDHVEAKRPPAVDGTEGSARLLKSLFPRTSGPMVRASDEAELLARQYFERKDLVTRAEQRLEETKQLLQTACGAAEGIVSETWRLQFKYREPVEVKPAPYTRPGYRHFDLRKIERKAQPKRNKEAA